ncbi:MAG TPA: PQQ-binding-like beta-propeller repeat protein [Ktedonobacterales bacterium]|jgi:outer membrane protein assembly factor BamB
MRSEEETFSPETVDEQVEQLAQSLYAIPSRQGRTADAQLVQNLRRMYELEQEDARSVARVQRQLEQQGWLASERRASRPERGRRPGRRSTPAPEIQAAAYRERAAPRPRGWTFRLAAIAAVLLVTTLIGGLIVGLVLVRNGNGSTPTPTATAVPSGPTATATPSIPPSVYGVTNNAVVALNLADGKVRWQRPFTPEPGTFAYLQQTDDTLYLQPGPGFLTVINKDDGSVLWQQEDVGLIRATKGLAVIASLLSNSVTFTAYDPRTEKKLWSFQAPNGNDYEDMVLGDHVVYVESQDNPATADDNPHYFLYALDRATGKQLWSRQSPAYFQSVTAFGDTVYIVGGTAPQIGLFAVNASNGKERWHITSTNDTEFFPPVVMNGVVYVPRNGYIQDGGGSGVLLALRESDGKELWHSAPSQENVVYSEPTVANGAVYVTDQQYVYAFNATNGSLLWQKQIGYMYDPPTPIVRGNLLYVQWFAAGGNIAQAAVEMSALDVSNRHEVWRYEVTPPNPNAQEHAPGGPGNVTLLESVILTSNASGDLVALSADTGQKLWQSAIFNQPNS